MSLLAVVEVVVGIVSLWTILSLFTIVLQPWVSIGLRKRASDIEQAIARILVDPPLIAQFYNHPIIRGLKTESSKSPPRIPARQFALTLFDIVLTAATESSLIQQGLLKVRDNLEKVNKMPSKEALILELNLLVEMARSAAATEAGSTVTNKTLSRLKNEINQFSNQHPDLRATTATLLNEAASRKDEMENIIKHQPKTRFDSLDRLRRGVAALSVISPALNQTLNALFLNIEEYTSEGETHLAQARKNVEEWFDASMANKSGDLKRYSQRLALLIGFILAFFFNLDTINLTIYFWRDATLREFIMKDTSSFKLSLQDPKATEELRNQLVKLNLPIGWVIKETKSASYYDNECQLFPGNSQKFGVPVIFSNKCIAPLQADNQTNILFKLIGILITALAARQGADYWFEILLTSLGGIPPKEKEEKH